MVSMSAIDDWLTIHNKSERALAKVVTTYFTDQRKRILEAAKSFDTLTPSLVPQLFNEADEHELLIGSVGDSLVNMLAGGVVRMRDSLPASNTKAFEVDLDDFELSQDIKDAIANAFTDLAGQSYWQDIQSGTTGNIIDSLTAGIEAGDSMPNLTKRLQKDLDGISKVRAAAIARTETTLAYNNGHSIGLQSLKDDGEAVKKEWLAVIDGDTRESHVNLNGTVVEVDEDFSIGGAFPGDAKLPASERVNCRCTIVSVFD